jgi:hypothetical protein
MVRSSRRGESSRGTRAGVRVKEAVGCAAGQSAAGGERGRRGTRHGTIQGHRDGGKQHRRLPHLATEPPGRLLDDRKAAAARVDGGGATLGFNSAAALER